MRLVIKLDAPSEFDLHIVRGADANLVLHFEDNDSAAIDITGWIFESFSLLPNKRKNTVTWLETGRNNLAGSVTFSLMHADTSDPVVLPDNLEREIFATDQAGTRLCRVSGVDVFYLAAHV